MAALVALLAAPLALAQDVSGFTTARESSGAIRVVLPSLGCEATIPQGFVESPAIRIGTAPMLSFARGVETVTLVRGEAVPNGPDVVDRFLAGMRAITYPEDWPDRRCEVRGTPREIVCSANGAMGALRERTLFAVQGDQMHPVAIAVIAASADVAEEIAASLRVPARGSSPARPRTPRGGGRGGSGENAE